MYKELQSYEGIIEDIQLPTNDDKYLIGELCLECILGIYLSIS
jgi:hypothetical protein